MRHIVLVLLFGAVACAEECSEPDSSQCAGLASQCSVSLIKLSCPATCGVCTNGQKCNGETDPSSCAELKTFCSLDIIKESCKATCNNCEDEDVAVTSTTTETTATSTTTTADEAVSGIKDGKCNGAPDPHGCDEIASSFCLFDFIKSGCQVLCNTCTASTTSTTVTSITTATTTTTLTTVTGTSTTTIATTVTTVTTTTELPENCILSAYEGPASNTKGVKDDKIGDTVDDVASAEDCGKICQSLEGCTAFSYQSQAMSSDGTRRCQLFAQTSAESILSGKPYNHYNANELCAITTSTTATSTTATSSTTTTIPTCNGEPDPKGCAGLGYLCISVPSLLVSCPLECMSCPVTTRMRQPATRFKQRMRQPATRLKMLGLAGRPTSE